MSETQKLRKVSLQALETLELITECFLDTEGSYGYRESQAIEVAYNTIASLRAVLISGDISD